LTRGLRRVVGCQHRARHPLRLPRFRRAPLAALTIAGTVALGLGLVAVVFTFYNE
jgi:hypothetical protein